MFANRLSRILVPGTLHPQREVKSVSTEAMESFLPLLNPVVSCLCFFRKASGSCGFAMVNTVCNLSVHAGNQ